jgi:hypothetical protein
LGQIIGWIKDKTAFVLSFMTSSFGYYKSVSSMNRLGKKMNEYDMMSILIYGVQIEMRNTNYRGVFHRFYCGGTVCTAFHYWGTQVFFSVLMQDFFWGTKK